MKLLLMFLLIIGMFVSFTAALLAMLFFTKTIETPEELRALILEKPDSTRLSKDLILREDKLNDLFRLAEEFRNLQEKQRQQSEVLQDSLTREKAQINAEKDALNQEKQKLGLLADSTARERKKKNLDDLAKFYSKVKAQSAAEILQEEGVLTDTTVAQLLRRLPPAQAGKIMGFMNTDFAARITRIMKELE